MPNSKHRKKQVAANKRQLEKAKKRVLAIEENNRISQDIINKENEFPVSTKSAKVEKESHSTTNLAVVNKIKPKDQDEGYSWFGNLYGWCQAGFFQVVSFIVPSAIN